VEKETVEKLNKELEEKICTILEEGIQPGNIEMLDMLVDIHKDVANEEHWERKDENMRYSNYGRDYNDYGRRGGYNEGSYNARRRDSRGRYKGHDYIDEMYGEYGNYEEGRQEYNRGNYGTKESTLKSLEYMLESAVNFFEMLKQDAASQQEQELIRRYAQQIADM
jgi:hypothetical protein